MNIEMRRKDKEMDKTGTIDVLLNSRTGRLGTCSDNIPYITPVNYIYYDGCIYFHCARVGRKIDNIKLNNNVCFEVDDYISTYQQEDPRKLSTNYKSVIIFGKAEIIDDEDVKLDIMKRTVDKYSNMEGTSNRLLKEHTAPILIVKITPEHITGKISIK